MTQLTANAFLDRLHCDRRCASVCLHFNYRGCEHVVMCILLTLNLWVMDDAYSVRSQLSVGHGLLLMTHCLLWSSVPAILHTSAVGYVMVTVGCIES